jgi:hypothetical protein
VSGHVGQVGTCPSVRLVFKLCGFARRLLVISPPVQCRGYRVHRRRRLCHAPCPEAAVVASLDAIRVRLRWKLGAQTHYVCLLIVEPYARNAPEGLDGALCPKSAPVCA